MKRNRPCPDLHYFYEAAVQGVEHDLDVATRVFKNRRGYKPRTLREDFCGTAALACEWVRRNTENRAWGVDIDPLTLQWAEEHNVPYIGSHAGTITLLCGDVRTVQTPPVDLLMALNFSYCIFKTREQLRSYFQTARRNLTEDGLFMADLYGGTEAIQAKLEPREVDSFTAKDGTEIPEFEYIWDQSEYNVIDHHAINHIHFRIPEIGKIQKAFTYDWRLWSLPEVQELMLEAGFQSVEIYLHGWTDNGESDEIYRRRTRYENSLGWVAYIAGIV